jgi:hypothetical protein
VRAVLADAAVPEVLAWSGADLTRRLDALAPHAVVVVSLRAHRLATLSGRRPVVLDLVDPLDRAYADRRALVGGWRGRGYGWLAIRHRRVQRHLPLGADRVVVAGYDDARDLGVDWLPVTVDDAPHVPAATPDHDLVFTGTLSYPPNVGALRRLARLWPRLLACRPGTTLLVAGAGPGPEVASLCHDHGWTLVPDFAALADVLARARLAVAPLEHAAGIQIKVLDAAAAGVPQVVTPEATRGFAPDLDVPRAPDDDAFVAMVVAALADRTATHVAAARLRRQVLADYGTARWAGTARDLVAG